MNKDEAVNVLSANLVRAKYGLAVIQNDEEIVQLGDNRFITKSAFQSQDSKSVPLKWGYEQSNNVIGTADLKIEDDGLHAECKINGEWYEDYINCHLKWYQKIIRWIKKKLGIVSPTEKHWPWEEVNCDLSMKFKEDKYDSRIK